MGNDIAGLAVSSALALLLLLLPGALLAKVLQRVAPETDWKAFAPALAVGLLPLIDSLAIRLGGVHAALAVRALLVAAALLVARDFIPRWRWPAAFAATAWVGYLAILYVDVDIGHALHQPVTVLDLTKHAAIVREIGLRGLPLQDPFFLRAQAAGYYHFFYDGAAVVDAAGGALNDARMAFAGAAFAVGIALASFLRALVVDLGWQRATDRRLTLIVIAACAIGGLDLVGIAGRWLATGLLEANAEWWDDEISFLPTAASWVPHHLAGVIAVWLALLLLSKAVQSAPRRAAALAAIAGLAMANAFGLSIWVTIGGAAILAISLRNLRADTRVKWTVGVAIAGAAALVLSAMQIADLFHGRTDGGFPLGLWIREPAGIGMILGQSPALLALALTPLAWTLEFGAFALGAWLFRRGSWNGDSPFARVLGAAFVGGLLMNLLLRSTIINNDFGWRVAWFAQLPAMLWTIAALQHPIKAAALRWAMGLAIALGLAATVYNALAARWVRPPLATHHQFAYINADPATDYGLARAYRWANRHLPADAVLQHNPLGARRVFDFGLYSDHRVAVADSEAELFGAPRPMIVSRLTRYGRIFAGQSDLSGAGPVHLVVTSRDPLWSRLLPADCMYRAGGVCISKGIGR